MAVKTNGAQFKRFYNDNDFWPEGENYVWHDDESIVIDGAERNREAEIDEISDTAVVVISGGCVFGPAYGGGEPSFEAYFKRWRKLQNTTSFVVECDKALFESVKAAIVAAGGSVQA
jgi:hypothetical protein